MYYGGPRIDLSQQLTEDGARVIALYQDAPAVQDWFSGAGYRVVDRTNFGSIDVWRVARANTG